MEKDFAILLGTGEPEGLQSRRKIVTPGKIVIPAQAGI
jgi:hypothetical protein